MTCVYWNEEIDLSMDCVYKYGSVAYTVEQGTNERSLSPVHLFMSGNTITSHNFSIYNLLN